MASKRHFSGGVQPPYSFKDCLRSHLEGNNAALSEDERTILQRWLGDWRANEVWGIIFAHARRTKAAAPVWMMPISFIGVILTAKSASERESELIPRLTELQAGREKALANLRKKIAEKIMGLPENELAPFLGWALNKLLGLDPMVMSQPRVRSDKSGSRARTLFMQDVGACVRDDLTGEVLDEQVGIITEIVFDTDESISVDAVRHARPERPNARRQKSYCPNYRCSHFQSRI